MPLRRYKPEQIVTALRQIEGAVAMTNPIFCTNPSKRVYITAWGCEIGSGGRKWITGPRRRGPVIQRRVRSPGVVFLPP